MSSQVKENPPPESVDLIRQQMSVVRRELHHDADGVVDNAWDLADWKHYVRSCPWACLGAAAAIGYLLIPQKVSVMRPSSDQLETLARRQHLVVEPDSSASNTRGWKGKVFTLASNLAMRAALAYVGQQFGKQAGEGVAEATSEQQPVSH